MGKPGAPVVIVRKDKKLGPFHGAAAILTGGASLLYTAPKAASNAAYNARTRELQNAAGQAGPRQSGRVQEPPPPGWHPLTLAEQAENSERLRSGAAKYEAMQERQAAKAAEREARARAKAERAEAKAGRRAGRHRAS